MPYAHQALAYDFTDGDYTINQTIDSSVSVETTLGPWRTPWFGGQSADVISVWFTSTADFAITVDLETAPTPDGPWVAVRNADDPTDLEGRADGIQALHVAGDLVRLKVTPTTLGADLNILLKAKANG